LSPASPPYKWPCFYGLDTGKRSDLLAADMSVGEIKDYLGVDSLAYLDLDRLITATAILESAMLVTKDERIRGFAEVRSVW
jgi:glutamine phosphoribosylpyrophosphate amidotransferase